MKLSLGRKDFLLFGKKLHQKDLFVLQYKLKNSQQKNYKILFEKIFLHKSSFN